MSKQAVLQVEVWAACEAFRGDMPFTQSRDHALALIFLKYISDVWRNQQARRATALAQGNRQSAATSDAADDRVRFHFPQIDVVDAKDDILIDRFVATIDRLYTRRDQADIGALLDRIMVELEKHNQAKLSGVFRHLCFDAEAVLGSGLQRNTRLRNFLSFLTFLELDTDMAAYPALFLYLIERFALEDASTPETPRQIVRLLHHLAKPRPGEHIADPVAGSASLLLGSSHHGVALVLAGQEATHALWAIAVMNLLIHEQDDATMKRGDSLRAPQLLNEAKLQQFELQQFELQQFDVVLANPPQRAEPWMPTLAMKDRYGRFTRGVPPKTQAEFAWISHCLAMTRPGNGRLAMIMPARVLYRGGVEGAIRQSLIDENLLDTVILLPPNVLPHASGDMLVCLFDRSREAGGARKHVRDVLLIDASVGLTRNRQRCLLNASQINQIILDVNARQNQGQGQRCHLASIEEIAANDYDLSLPRYLRAHEPHPARDLPGEAQEIAALAQTLLGLQNQMTQQLATLVGTENEGQANSSSHSAHFAPH